MKGRCPWGTGRFNQHGLSALTLEICSFGSISHSGVVDKEMIIGSVGVPLGLEMKVIATKTLGSHVKESAVNAT